MKDSIGREKKHLIESLLGKTSSNMKLLKRKKRRRSNLFHSSTPGAEPGTLHLETESFPTRINIYQISEIVGIEIRID